MVEMGYDDGRDERAGAVIPASRVGSSDIYSWKKSSLALACYHTAMNQSILFIRRSMNNIHALEIRSNCSSSGDPFGLLYPSFAFQAIPWHPFLAPWLPCALRLFAFAPVDSVLLQYGPCYFVIIEPAFLTPPLFLVLVILTGKE